MRLPLLAARIFNTPLMVDARKAATILQAAGSHFLPGQFEGAGFPPGLVPRAGVVGDPLGTGLERRGEGGRLLAVSNGIAVISIEGTLVHKGKWIGMDSGETSYEGVQAQVQRAGRDPAVKGVVFEVDSYGGEVSGAFDTADMIAALSAAKPTIAILTDVALSAGYLLASAARAIVAPVSGAAGSIGVITMHVDESQALAAEGIKVTLLYSGAHKADGNPYEPLSAEAAANVKAKMDGMRDQFADAVGRYRGKRMSKQKALATEAEYFTAEEAMSRGLIDATARPSEAFSGFARALIN